MGRLVVVTGVGTEVGKTTLGVALARGLAASGLRVCGYKPVESGLGPGAGGDAGALDDAGTFHVKPTPLYGFAEPISPHLAAERAGLQVDVEAIVAVVEAARKEVDVLLVELAGGLFTPLGPETDNANLLEALRPDEALLVVPDASTGTNSAALRGLFRGTHHVPWRSAGLSAADLCSLLAVCRPSPV